MMGQNVLFIRFSRYRGLIHSPPAIIVPNQVVVPDPATCELAPERLFPDSISAQ